MSPTSLTTAFLITQIFLLLIVYFGILALRYGEKTFSAFSNNPRPATRNLPSLVFGFSFVTLAPLAFSQDFVLLSQPAFGDVLFPALPRDDAFLIVFLLDIIGAGILMGFTGGAKDSPFSAVLFALPALSIFLRENPTRFSRSNSSGNAVLENPKHVLAFQLVTLGCLALSTLVGYATRPL
jgi:hypothetical protein